MTAFLYPAASIPVNAFQPIPAGTLVGNKTNASASPTAISGYASSTVITASATIAYTGIKTSVRIDAAAAGAVTVTLPTTPPIDGNIIITNESAFQATITPPAGATIDGLSSYVIPPAIAGAYPSVTLVVDSSTLLKVE
jgi:hypothetical protein